MASAEQIKALVHSHLDGDEEQFYSVAMQMAAAAARKGQGKFAQELRTLIDQARNTATLKPVNAPTPISRPRGELADLLTVSSPKIRLADMTLDERLANSLKRILNEQRHFDRLRSHGLSPRRKLLFTGPPGTGKTMSAAVLASALNLPLFTVRLDGLITRYLGESIAKLRLIFDALAQTRAVYLFDEFDSIGTHRGFANDVGEIKRVLNSFLMFIEQDHSNSLIIAATNHPQSLDYALFRRFDELVEFSLPKPELIIATLKQRLASSDCVKVDFEQLAKAADGLSFAEITQACDDAMKEAFLQEQRCIKTSDVLTPLAERVRFHQRFVVKSPNPIE
ncbi:MAG TPA: ATP-binding protein [Blastocatellia bacterium]|nr:ATP-binding protein [Blastocatellia bacterium]HMV85479.1 ATP-binding protein [Blastocatellia bacterium]HMX28533.1 ATP-binding protein [Blastocatellia bacterium]HMZ20893.1 ATP-binding protein [Blastocatellia bacterium]HNG34557.1 ATP-binding protein [Blastocatellia bacterium]